MFNSFLYSPFLYYIMEGEEEYEYSERAEWSWLTEK